MDKKEKGQLQSKWQKVIAKAMVDQIFRLRLMKNPREALKDHGIELPANINLKVLEETADTKYLVLPREGAGKLSEEDLKHIASGILTFSSFD